MTDQISMQITEKVHNSYYQITAHLNKQKYCEFLILSLGSFSHVRVKTINVQMGCL